MPKIKVKAQTVQTGERPQTNGRTDATMQTYYRPCYAVDNKRAKIDVRLRPRPTYIQLNIGPTWQ